MARKTMKNKNGILVKKLIASAIPLFGSQKEWGK